MTLPWTDDLVRIVRDAERDAGEMRVRLNTALLLRSVFRVPSAARDILSGFGVTLESYEHGLCAHSLRPEPSDMSQRLYDRASRLAALAREDSVRATHILMAILDERCMGQSLLLALGLDFERVRSCLYGHAEPVQTHAQAHVRSNSQVSMSAVAVQRKSSTLTPTRYIEPRPSVSFGQEYAASFEVGVADTLESLEQVPALPMRQKRMTPEEIQDLMPPVKRCNETAGADTGRRKSSPEQTVVSDGHSKALKKAPTARESQQATAVDLARRLQQKQTPSIETERVKPAEQSQSSAKKPEAARDGAGSGSKKASTGAQSVETSETEARRSTPSQAPIISKKASQEVRNLHSVNDANSVYTRQKSQSSQSRRAPAGFNPLNLSPSKYPTLCRFGRNLLAEAQSGRIAPVIQRDHEIAQLIDILNKRRSNNPILIGEAGVGKTAIIEGLALRMAQHEAPPSLNQHTIIALDHGAMLCGTQLRGAVQERIHAIKSEVRNANGHIILFLDEIHSWLSSSPGDPNTDAALELKIALSRGELMCIGAATPAELRRAFDSDPAFERRFDFIEVKAPDAKTSIDIIRQGIIRQYATHHGVEYEDTAIVSAVKLADRYIQERALPDKALSVLDRAGSFCVRSGDTRVDTRHVAHVISQVTEVPVERLLMTEKQKLMQMETLLGRRLVGHEANVAKMSQVIRRNHAGFGAQRPIGSFLFLGPTGVGKTEAAKVLADFLFGSDKNIVRFDMSEYMESHAVAKLIGAPAGYVGFDDGGLLTEALRKRPYQIVLFDEIEKAHPDIMNILLQILDEGRLTDAKGRHVNFSNAVIIMTSNLGAQDVMRATRKGIGFDRKIDSLSPSEAEQIILKAALARFSPELWNRIEEKLVFHPLSIDQIERIASLLLLDSGRRLFDDKHIRLHFDEASIVPYLLSHGGFDPNYGARPMRKTIQSLIESRIAEWILAHDALPDALHVNVEDETVIVRL